MFNYYQLVCIKFHLFPAIIRNQYKAYNNLHVYPFRFTAGLNDGHTHSHVCAYLTQIAASVTHYTGSLGRKCSFCIASSKFNATIMHYMQFHAFSVYTLIFALALHNKFRSTSLRTLMPHIHYSNCFMYKYNSCSWNLSFMIIASTGMEVYRSP